MDARLVVTANIVWTRQATIVAVTTVAQQRQHATIVADTWWIPEPATN